MEKKFLQAEDVARELGISKPYAYKIIHKLNDELAKKGLITISGKVNRQYFEERVYGSRQKEES